MITEWLPDATKVGLLYCSAEANSQYQVDEVQKYLEAKGVTATQYAFSDSNDLASVCQKAADENDALYVPTDNTVAANTGIVDGICRPAKKPRLRRRGGHLLRLRRGDPVYQLLRLGLHHRRDGSEDPERRGDISTMPIEYTECDQEV